MVVYTGRIVSVVADETPIENVKSMKWEQKHEVTPQLLPSNKNPVGWLQGHSWIEGEIMVVSKDPTLEEDLTADATVFDEVVVTAISIKGVEESSTLASLVVTHNEKAFTDEGEPATIYHFKAKSATEFA